MFLCRCRSLQRFAVFKRLGVASGMLQPWCGLRGLKSREVPVPIGLWRKKAPPIILEYANENHPNLGFWASKLSDASLNFPNHGVVAAHFRAA